ncbi:MAG: Dolichyl-diphosphooligosaccharide- glycosyltransferase subunit [Lasallia pustulata]|uniref:Dolichyl-diphosphooligosaccharide--protein glycosyltransferase subunit WBP1 n=1 Tax=Lasallia pustulata TaxID=136370 RepID=A0A5M8PZP9_9LECA|nr:MAG: Dolichyl-diphosphooligosaccharide- glycosyltransferase subunit [Lasallia pustulata]
MRWLFSFLLLALLSLVQALSSSGSRLLVVIEEAAEKEKYSQFLGGLEDRGFKLSYESPKNDKLALFRLGERVYDHIILLPPKSKGLGPALTPNILLQFVNKGGNILLALSADSPTPNAISSLLLELDIHLPPDRTSLVVDHFNYDTTSASEKHDVLLLPQPKALRSDVTNFFGGDGTIAFPRSVAQELGNASPLLAPILTASSTAYTYNPKDEAETVEDPFAVGQQIALVSAMQARNSARFTVFGSVEALENQWFDATVTGLGGKETRTANRDFAKQITAWTFMETGVLKVGRVEHHLSSITKGASGNESVSQLGYLNPTIYRVKNDVTFTIEMSSYNHDHLEPLAISPNDALQLEFTMLSPFHRLNLQPISTTANSTLFSASFRVPDQHGIYAFRVNYKRPFWTNMDVKREVTVRHFAHDEWPRSWEISAGWVWIAGVWSTAAGWVVFVAIWLYSEPTFSPSAGKKMQ